MDRDAHKVLILRFRANQDEIYSDSDHSEF